MTRKDFEPIAKAIKTLPLPAEQKQTVAIHMANELEWGNPRFDSAKFIHACLKA